MKRKEIKHQRKESIKRLIKKKRIFKTLTWRFISTFTTFLIAYIITGSLKYGGYIAMIETFVKSSEYWAHEYFWEKYTKRKIKEIKKKFNI